MSNHEKNADTRTQDSAQLVLDGKGSKNLLKRLLPFFGPAFIASIAYVDPGNFATNIQAGSAFGYTLIWVIVASNLMAMLIQTLSAKLGIGTGKNLAEHCREQLPRPVIMGMWILMELVAIATDLAEFLGAALGFNMLLGIPLFWGGILTAIFTYLILGLERYGFKPFEAIITGFVAVIALSYLFEILIARPDWPDIGYHLVLPRLKGPESVVLAAGILGATVMPHAIFLHSALTQGRIKVTDPVRLKKLFHYEIVDVVVAMGVASLVNGAMLIMAASTFYKVGFHNIASIEEAHKTLEPLLGKASQWVFALSLLASGLSSSAVGTSAGQIIMQGFLKRHIPVVLRRLITILPALLVIILGFDPTGTLVLSQVVLSFGLPFVIIPLILFTRDTKIMGSLANKRSTTWAASLVAAVIIVLNVYLIVQLFIGGGN